MAGLVTSIKSWPARTVTIPNQLLSMRMFNLIIPWLSKDQERDFKLKENVACGPGSTIDNLNSDRNDCDMYTAIIVLTQTEVADIKPL